MAKLNLGNIFATFDIDTGKAGRSLGKVEKKTSALGNALKGLATAYVAKQLADLGKAAVMAASDFEETTNVMQQGFGDSVGAAEEWAKKTGEAVGRSTQQMRQFVSVNKAMLDGLTGGIPAADEMSKGLAQLAVDMGSFWNVADEDAWMALKSAISGELEPMKRFGVVMTEAALNAYALEQGINKTVQKMTEAQKAVLRYNFIMDRTASAHGDAERTSESFANQLKQLEANVKNLAVEIGKELLPIVKQVVDGLNLIITGGDIAADAKNGGLRKAWKDAEKLAAAQERVLGGISTDIDWSERFGTQADASKAYARFDLENKKLEELRVAAEKAKKAYHDLFGGKGPLVLPEDDPKKTKPGKVTAAEKTKFKLYRFGSQLSQELHTLGGSTMKLNAEILTSTIRTGEWENKVKELMPAISDEEVARLKAAAALDAFEGKLDEASGVIGTFAQALGLGPEATRTAQRAGVSLMSGGTGTKAGLGGLAGMGAAGAAGLAVELVTTIHGAIMGGFEKVAAAAGEWAPQIGRAMSAGSGMAAFGVLSLGGVVSAIGALPAFVAAAGMSFVDLVKQTDAYAEAQSIVAAGSSRLVAALEPFAEKLIPTARLIEQLFGALTPILAAFTGKNVGAALFDAVKFLASAFLDAAIFISGLANLLGADIDVDAMKASQDLLNSMKWQATQMGITGKRMRYLEEQAGAAGDRMQSLADATVNLPSWFKVNGARFDAADPLGGNPARGMGDFGTRDNNRDGVTIVVNGDIIADSVDDFVSHVNSMTAMQHNGQSMLATYAARG